MDIFIIFAIKLKALYDNVMQRHYMTSLLEPIKG